jgi:hypothetical protein
VLPEPVTAARRLLIRGGLVAVLLGLLLGLVQGISAGGDTLLGAREPYADLPQLLAGPEAVMPRLEARARNLGRLVHAHGHLVNLGLVAIALGLLLPAMPRLLSRARVLAVAYLWGSALFMAGILLPSSLPASALAAAGGVLVIAVIVLSALAALRGPSAGAADS